MIEVKRLTPDMCEDYIDFFENRAFSDGNINKGCYCVWHHWTERHEYERSLLPKEEQPSVKKHFAEQLIKEGRLNGFAAYCEGEIAGFCNADKKENYFRLSKKSAPEMWTEDEDSSRTLALVCFTVDPKMRGKGVASAMLKAACEYAENNGYRRIESYPSDGEFSQHNCCGNVSMYTKQGFSIYNVGNGIVARKEIGENQ